MRRSQPSPGPPDYHDLPSTVCWRPAPRDPDPEVLLVHGLNSRPQLCPFLTFFTSSSVNQKPPIFPQSRAMTVARSDPHEQPGDIVWNHAENHRTRRCCERPFATRRRFRASGTRRAKSHRGHTDVDVSSTPMGGGQCRFIATTPTAQRHGASGHIARYLSFPGASDANDVRHA